MTSRAIPLAAALSAAFALATPPARAADAAPAFDARSSAAAPCGTGTPPPGHALPEVRAASGVLAIDVKQAGDRLCYVVDDDADAPVIRVRQGARLDIALTNDIADPSRIEAAMTRGTLKTPNAPVPRTPGFDPVEPGMHHAATGATNLHLHGFAVPPVAPQDDVMTVCTDPASGPAHCGQRSFTYRFRLPADMPAGLYWYHPHVHGEVQAQMLMGLAGPIVVEGPADDARRAAGVVERVWVVRQTQDQDAGRTPDASMTGAANATLSPAAIRRADTIDTAHELLCTQNAAIDQISLNGTPVPIGDAPDTALAHVEIAPGRPQFWRLLNAATDAFLDLALVDDQGHPLPLAVVARDGSPVTDDAGRPVDRQATRAPLPVPPAGRIEFWIVAPPAGRTAWLVTHAVDTGCAGDRLPERRLVRVTAASASTSMPPSTDTAPGMSVDTPPGFDAPAARDMFSGLLARKTNRVRTIAMAEYPRPGSADQTDFYMIERKPGAVLHPYMMGDAPAISVRAGTTEEWVIENWTNELHAFHIHQLHFRVLAIDGVPVKHPDLLDVVEVPYASATGFRSKDGPVRPGRVRIKLDFPATMAGDIPFHCHLVDHEDNGMMGVLRVLPARGARAPKAGGSAKRASTMSDGMTTR